MADLSRAVVHTVLAVPPDARVRNAVVHTVLSPDPGARVRSGVVHVVLSPVAPIPNPNPVSAAIIAT